MGQQQLWKKRVVQTVALFGAVLGLGLSSQVVAHADSLAIPDISEWQGKLSASQVAALKSQVSFVINRRQYGAGYQDKDATNNTALYVKDGIPFGEYDYARFTDAASAKREAQVFYDRSNKAAQFYVLDFEEDDVTSGGTNAAVKAWYTEMRSLTSKHLVFYSYQSFATTYANTARQAFDAQWIANYSDTPMISFALWQYTDHNYLTALNEYTDNSRTETAVHPVSWWTDSVALALTHTPVDSQNASATAANTGTTTPASASVPVAETGAFHFKRGWHVYLHRGATTDATGAKIPLDRRGRFYQISQVKSTTTGQSLYLSGLDRWVASHDVTGYWVGQHPEYVLTRKLHVYTTASLTRLTRSYYVAGDHIHGTVVKAPNGRAYRIKTKYGYITANSRDVSLG